MRHIFFLIVLYSVCGCREKYELVLTPSQTSFLVVEGFINTQGVTNINLSRTTILQERNVYFENNATVQIQGENNSIYPLASLDSGRYRSQELTLDENVRYRLNIKTQDSREYISNFTMPVQTPAIDTISYTRYQEGVEIFVNAKSNQNTQYYRFEYEEDWEFKSFYRVGLVSDFDPFSVTRMAYVSPFDPERTEKTNDSLFTCWQSRKSSALILGSTAKLNEDKVYLPIIYYPRKSWELSYLYSIKIRQFGLSKEGYDFYQKMKKNTEALGSIFDAQPSEITGNVKCVTDTSEIIIGHIDATSSTEKRAFIKNSDLDNWGYIEMCGDTLLRYTPDLVWSKLYDQTVRLTTGIYKDGALVGVYIAPRLCVDCTLRGKHERPSFWPN